MLMYAPAHATLLSTGDRTDMRFSEHRPADHRGVHSKVRRMIGGWFLGRADVICV